MAYGDCTSIQDRIKRLFDFLAAAAGSSSGGGGGLVFLIIGSRLMSQMSCY